MANRRGSPQNLKKGGTPGNKGGTGRPPDWLKQECQRLVIDNNIIGFLVGVARGDEIETATHYDLAGNEIGKSKKAASTKDRARAAEILLERGWGRAAQEVIHSGSIDTKSEEQKRAEVDEIKGFLGALMGPNDRANI